MVHYLTTLGYRTRRYLMSQVVPGTDLFRLIYGNPSYDLPLPLPSRGRGFLEFITSKVKNVVSEPIFGQVFSNDKAVVNQTFLNRDTQSDLGKLYLSKIRLSEAIQTVSASAIPLVDFNNWEGKILSDGGVHSDITHALDSYYFVVDNVGFNVRHDIQAFSSF